MRATRESAIEAADGDRDAAAITLLMTAFGLAYENAKAYGMSMDRFRRTLARSTANTDSMLAEDGRPEVFGF